MEKDIEASIKGIQKGFDEWDSLLKKMEEMAEKGFMPLLAKTFVLAQEVLDTYKNSFNIIIEKEIKNKK
jgi:hypothetical protein